MAVYIEIDIEKTFTIFPWPISRGREKSFAGSTQMWCNYWYLLELVVGRLLKNKYRAAVDIVAGVTAPFRLRWYVCWRALLYGILWRRPVRLYINSSQTYAPEGSTPHLVRCMQQDFRHGRFCWRNGRIGSQSLVRVTKLSRQLKHLYIN